MYSSFKTLSTIAISIIVSTAIVEAVPLQTCPIVDLRALSATDKKYFIITMGPPATGKSSSLKAVQATLGIQDDENLSIVVDDIVGEDPAFKASISQVQKALAPLSVIDDQMQKLLCGISQGIYFAHRKLSGADAKSDLMLFNGLIAKNNRKHIVYETTGSCGSYPWIITVAKEAKAHGFVPIIIYPIVRSQELHKRAFSRAQQEGRLPCRDSIKTIKEESCSNLAQAIDAITSASSADFPIEEIHVYDNNQTQIKEIFSTTKIQKNKPANMDDFKGFCLAD